MKMFIKKIKSLFSNGKSKESTHYENIKNGETLTFNGKKYIKVKLQFVDTLGYNTSKTIDNLETETKLLNEKIEKLTEKISSDEKEISLLRTLNTNLLTEEKKESTRLKNEIKKIKSPDEQLIKAVKNLETKLENQAKHIAGLDKINQKLKRKIKEKTYEFEKLEHKVHNLLPHNPTENSRKMRKRLNDKINELTTEINSLNDKLKQQEKLNENLLNKFMTEKQRL